jgi:DNA replication protein DnaC
MTISTEDMSDEPFLEDEAEVQAKAAKARELGAFCLGGHRAADEYRAERFIPSSINAAAFEATKSFDCVKENLFFCGSTGTGKSHLAAIAARRSFLRPGIDWSNRVRTLTPMELSRQLRSCDGAGAEDAVIRSMVSREVLVLEDLGVSKDTEFLVSAIYEVINGRYQNSSGGLIVTSNLTLGELAQKMGDDRVSSRLAQMCKIFNLRGEKDHRIFGKQ